MSLYQDRKIERMAKRVESLEDEVKTLKILIKTKIHDVIIDVLKQNLEIDLHYENHSDDAKLIAELERELNEK